MAVPRVRGEKHSKLVDLTRCCPEAQSDGVPCPTLGRSCEVCERALSWEVEPPPPPIRPAGND
jgi:hypothetical protein